MLNCRSTTASTHGHNSSKCSRRYRPIMPSAVESSSSISGSVGSSTTARKARTVQHKKRQQQQRRQKQQTKHQQAALSEQLALDELGCQHFASCPGCSLDQQLHNPPVMQEAQHFFASRGFHDFQTVPGPVYGWRCRAKLAVRGQAGQPEIGLFKLGTHDLVGMPDCRAHHPRVNQAIQLIKQVTAALRVQPYKEQQQQPRHKHASTAANRSSNNGNASRQGSGYLRYLQLTAVASSSSSLRAEEDPQAQIQLVLVWSASNASHPSVGDAKRLAAALWTQGGGNSAAAATANTLAALRARAEQATGVSNGRGNIHNRVATISRPDQQQQLGAALGASIPLISIKQHAAAAAVPPLFHSIWLNYQPDDDSNRILSNEWMLLHGPEWGWQEFGGVPVALAPGGFVQANYGAFQQCLKAIVAATPSGSTVLELYAGSGVIGLSLAATGVARRVLCVEVNPQSGPAFDITRAQLAKSHSGAAGRVSHIIGSAGDAKQLAPWFTQTQPNVLVVDPPRKGLDKAILALLTSRESREGGMDGVSCPDNINSGSNSRSASICNSVSVSSHYQQQQQQPQASGGKQAIAAPISIETTNASNNLTRLIYLSCGFQALMADTDALMANGWQLVSCQAYFFFPGTDSIETLAVFDRP